MRFLLLAAALILVSRSAAAQTTPKPLSFEVASVKPAAAPIPTKDEYSEGYNAGMRSALASFGMRITGQRVNITDNSLRDLIRIAYEVKDYQIAAPAWMSTEKYQIVANMPAGANRSQAPEMLRTLLEERFHLQLHRAIRTLAVYAIVAAKDGPKLTAAPKPGRGDVIVDGANARLSAKGATMSAFADLLTKVSDRPVIDSTGLPGVYDFEFPFAHDVNAAPENAAPSLSAQLAELGLHLEKREAAMPFLLIDSADKLPLEN